MFKAYKTILCFLLLGVTLSAFAQANRPDGFRERYTLKQVVVLSRHNIRSPLSGRRSTLQRLTPHEWFHWSSAPSELSLRGGALETMMGQYFRKWLVSEGLMQENEIPAEGTMRFYANSLQRTIATAQYFSSGMLPVANVRIEHHCAIGKMDSVFAPQITDDSDGFKALAQQQIARMSGEKGLVGIGERMEDNYKVLERVLDMEQSKACLEGDTCHFLTDDAHVYLSKYREPGMGGSLRLACQAADALVLQYYEEPDAVKAAFGDTLGWEDWESISAIKDWYGDVLFTAPVVARQVARPLLRTMLEELQNDGRKFTFLCGHDSNIGSVLAALEAEDYSLPNTIEKKTPIGCKLVIEKWVDTDGKPFAALNLVYQSTNQLRNMTLLDLENPPMVFPIRLEGLTANDDGLYPFEAVVERFIEVTAQNKIEGETFELTKQGAHYVFTASINGTADAHILLESGIPALLVDSAYVFSSGILSDMELDVAVKEKLNLGGRVYKITHKANGTVRIGNSTTYDGEVFVLSNYDFGPYEVAVPVMYLHNDLDEGSRIVSLDLGNQSLQMLSRASLDANKADYSESNMNTDTYMGMFAIETSITLDDGIKPRTLSGNFMIDFGNPELLFLFHQTEEVQKFLADNADMELREATTPSGDVVGQFILTKQCQLYGITFPDAVVVITKNLPLFTTPGNIGLKFFERTPTVFDFDQSVVYMKGK